MARQPRVDLAGYTYHVINRANGRVPIFASQKDFLQFERVLIEAKERVTIDIEAFCIMPNHFHLALRTKRDGDLQEFMGWLTKTQTQRWHVAHETVGHGHLYQGRYKSFIVNTDGYYLTLMRYIEQNPLRAGLVKKVEDWKWGSLYWKLHGTKEQQALLSGWQVSVPRDYLAQVNTLLKKDTLAEIRTATVKGSPLGGHAWRAALISSLGLEHTTRSAGRPKNGS
jgi:putative transposase